jgi:hypothetical protein
VFGGGPFPANTQDLGQAKAPDPAASNSPHPATDSRGETTARTQTQTNRKQAVHAADQLSSTAKRFVAEEGNQSTDKDIRHDKVPIAVLLGLGGGLVFVGICWYHILIERRAHEAQSAPSPDGPAETCSDVVRLLEPIAGDFAGMGRSLAVVQCGLEQLAARQEQMVQNIARLQAAEVPEGAREQT